MSDEKTIPGSAPEAPTQPRMQALGQYIRDLSFENVAIQKGVEGNSQPEVQVAIQMDARQRGTLNQYEVIHKYRITSKVTQPEQTVFILELEYGGVFTVEGVPEESLHPFLLIECSRVMFPFERRIVADITRDGGFPPLNLDNVDFLKLYREELQRRTDAAVKPDGSATV